MGGERRIHSSVAPAGTEPTPFEQMLSALSSTQVAHALATFVFALVTFVALLAIADWQLESGYPPAGVIVAIPALIAALPLALGRLGHSLAYVQAAFENVTQRDLNDSGDIGDVVIEPEERVVTEHHFIKQSGPPLDVIPVLMPGGETVRVKRADLRVVIEDGTLVRGRWLGQNDAEPLPPFSEHEDHRGYYDAIMAFLDKMQLTRRGANNARVLVQPSGEIIAALKL